MSNKLNIIKSETSKIPNTDFNNLAFGAVFTDHMFTCEFKNGEWINPTIEPYGPLTLDPSARVFHYGQAVFEGMKAFKDDNNNTLLFRPEENHKRINISAERLAMPTFPKELFFEGLENLLKIDNEWIKPGQGKSLYIRPFVIATEPAISASAASEYKFVIICAPVQSYYGGDVRVLIAEKYSRSANGGTGYAKAAGNYAGQFYPTKLANEEGYQQIIWTDADKHENLEEAGTMNIFFRVGDKLITAPTSDRILDGITRKSLIQIAEDNNIEVEIRNFTVTELIETSKSGELKEIFGSGTAAILIPILGFKRGDYKADLPKVENSYADLLKKSLNDIQYNLAPDTHNWNHIVK